MFPDLFFLFPHWFKSVIAGLGVSPNLGNAGRLINSMGNLVSGGNVGRNLSSGGGLNMPGVASRLNLTGNKDLHMSCDQNLICNLGLNSDDDTILKQLR